MQLITTSINCLPPREIIQRMNFLHQAAVLVSGALYTPTPSTSKVTQDAASLAQERQKQASTYKQAHDMVQKGQFISTQPGEDPTNRVAIQAETKAAVPASKRGPRKPEINNEFDKLRGKHIEEFLECWNEQGLTPEEIKVKLNKRKKSSRRRAAKVNMAPLYIGNTSFAPKEKDIFVSNHTEKRQKTNLPLHPSQIEHRNLACHYVNDIRTMARKNVLRM